MRLYLSIDMEGMPGTWSWQQEKKDRTNVKKAIYNHVKDVLDSIFESEENERISEIVIADAHGSGDNLDYEITGLDKRINLVSGSPRPYYMMPAFDREISAVFFLGYHAGSGSMNASMDHTYCDSSVHELVINGMKMNEALINAAYAGHHNVPVVLITGDIALYQELRQTPLSKTEFVVTKEAVSRFAAKNYSLIRVREEIKRGVAAVFQKKEAVAEVFRFTPPVTLQITFNNSSMADMASLIPHTTRLSARTVSYTDEDYSVIMEAIMAYTSIAYWNNS